MTKNIDLLEKRFIPVVDNNLVIHEKDTYVNINQSQKESEQGENAIIKDTYNSESKSKNDPEVQKYLDINKSKKITLKKSNLNSSPEEIKSNIKENSDERTNSGIKEFSESEKKIVEDLKKIDQEVRNHEAAHRSAGGGLVRGGTAFTYTTGPDGKHYAVAGEVKIDFSYDLDDPEETIRTMQQIKRAALAPADPSTQDRVVATKAANLESLARTELMKERSENVSQKNISINLLEKKYQSSEFKKDAELKSDDTYSKLI